MERKEINAVIDMDGMKNAVNGMVEFAPVSGSTQGDGQLYTTGGQE